MRRLIEIASKGERLLGTLDLPDRSARIGVLIVSGGSEIRAGSHRGMATLARELAMEGLAVLRFDRAGVGDSTGTDTGFRASLPDIFNAALVLGNETGVEGIVGVGNCDAASALALFGRRAGVDRVVLCNPWLREEGDGLPPTAAIRARYAGRVGDPRTLWRLLTGKIDLRAAARGVAKLLRPVAASEGAAKIIDGITNWGADAAVVLAEGDATAIAFAAQASGRFPVRRLATASHSFAGDEVRRALLAAIVSEATALAATLDT